MLITSDQTTTGSTSREGSRSDESNEVLLMGNRRIMPTAFPSTMNENAGNMVHADAAFRIVKRSKFHSKEYPAAPNLARYVEEHCSHIVYIFANALRMGDQSPRHFERTVEFLKATTKPVVVFGLGAQASSLDEYDADLPAAAIEMLKRISDRCTTIGVRGAFTKQVLNHIGITNVRVTGCPSLFSSLNRNFQISNPSNQHCGEIAFAGTKFYQQDELDLLAFAIRNGFTHVEPVNKLLYEANFSAKIQHKGESQALPYFIERIVKNGQVERHLAERYVRNSFNMFWDMESWKKFNRERVRFTYGTRFHVNMASLISGVPALWVTHDSRTQELTDFMCLPSTSVENAKDVSDYRELLELADYSRLNQNYSKLYDNFRSYLDENFLPHNL